MTTQFLTEDAEPEYKIFRNKLTGEVRRVPVSASTPQEEKQLQSRILRNKQTGEMVRIDPDGLVFSVGGAENPEESPFGGIPSISKPRENQGIDERFQSVVSAIRGRLTPEDKAGAAVDLVNREADPSQKNNEARINPNGPGDMSRGWNRGVEGLKSSGYGALGLVGSAVGADGLRDYGFKKYKEKSAEAEKYPGRKLFDDVYGPSSAVDWAQGELASLAPSMIEAGVTAAVGAGIGSLATPGPGTAAGTVSGFFGKQAVKGMMKNQIESLVARGASKEAAKKMAEKGVEELSEAAINQMTKAAMKRAGAKAGVIAGTAPIESGGNWGEGVDRGFDAPFTALATGTAAGFLELAGGNIRILDKVLGKPVKEAAEAAIKAKQPGIVARFFVEAAKQAPAEFAQEAGQELLSISNIAMNDPTFEVFTMENLKRLGEAGAAGALGGLAGGVGGVLNGKATTIKGQTDQTDTASTHKPPVLSREAQMAANATDEELADAFVSLSGNENPELVKVLAAEIARRKSARTQAKTEQAKPSKKIIPINENITDQEALAESRWNKNFDAEAASRGAKRVIPVNEDPEWNKSFDAEVNQVAADKRAGYEQQTAQKMMEEAARRAQAEKVAKAQSTPEYQARLKRQAEIEAQDRPVQPRMIPINQAVPVPPEAKIAEKFDDDFKARAAQIRTEYEKKKEGLASKNFFVSGHSDTIALYGYENNDISRMEQREIANRIGNKIPKGVDAPVINGAITPFDNFKRARKTAERLNREDGGKREPIKLETGKYGLVDITTPEGKNVAKILQNISYQRMTPEQRAAKDQEAQANTLRRQQAQAEADKAKADLQTHVDALNGLGVPTMRQYSESDKQYTARMAADFDRVVTNRKESAPVVEPPIVINGKTYQPGAVAEPEAEAEAAPEPDYNQPFDEFYQTVRKREHFFKDPNPQTNEEIQADYDGFHGLFAAEPGTPKIADQPGVETVTSPPTQASSAITNSYTPTREQWVKTVKGYNDTIKKGLADLFEKKISDSDYLDLLRDTTAKKEAYIKANPSEVYNEKAQPDNNTPDATGVPEAGTDSAPAGVTLEAKKAEAPVKVKTTGEGMKIVTAWGDAKDGDVLAEYDDGVQDVLVRRRIKKKADAQAVADEVGGRIMIDGKHSWAVSKLQKNEAPTPPTTDDQAGAGTQALPETRPAFMGRDEYVQNKKAALVESAKTTGQKTGKIYENKNLISRSDSEDFKRKVEIKHQDEVKKALQSGDLTPADYARLHEKDYGPIAWMMGEAKKADPTPREKMAKAEAKAKTSKQTRAERFAEKQGATETDPARVQEIKNSIAEGEGILRSGINPLGKKLSPRGLAMVQRSVDNAKAKIGDKAESPGPSALIGSAIAAAGKSTETSPEPKTDQGPSIAKPEDLNYDRAMRAHSGTSFSPEKRAKQRQQEYADDLNSIYQNLLKSAKTDEQKQIVESEIGDFKQKYTQKYYAMLDADSRTMSTMITGPANFPVKQNQKRMDTAQKRYEEFRDWREKAVKAIHKRITEQGISDAGGPIAILEKEIATLEKNQERMKAANKIIKSTKLLDDEKVQQIQEQVGLSEKVARELLKPDFAGRVGFASYQLTNNNATIKNKKARLEELNKRDAASGQDTVKKYDGVEVVNNHDEERLQLVFDKKPNDELRNELKAEGWRWSPSSSAWQRKNTPQAGWSAERILDKHFKPDGGENIKLQKSTATAPASDDWNRRALDKLTKLDKEILTRKTRRRQKIDSPTDQDLINFLSDAIHDKGLQDENTLRILKKLEGATDALYMVKKRGDNQRPTGGNAGQKFREGIASGGYRNTDRTRFYTAPETNEEKNAQKILKALGIDLYFFKSSGVDGIDFNGVMFPSDPGRVYVNKNSTNPLLQSSMHEWLHTLKVNHSDLYAYLDKVIQDNITDFEGFLKRENRDRTEVQKVYGDQAREEFNAEFTGDSMVDSEFLKKLYAALMEDNPTLGKRVLKVLKDIFERIIRAARRHVPTTYGHIKDVESAHSALVDVLKEVLERQGKTSGVNEFAQAPGVSLQKAVRSILDNPAFRKWFGKSAVTDEDGKPLVVYHGTETNFTEFNPSKLGSKTFASSAKNLGFFFSSERIAKTFGKNIMPVYLSIKNPLEISATDFQEYLFGEESYRQEMEDLFEELSDAVDSPIDVFDGEIVYQDNDTGRFEPLDLDGLDEETQEIAEKYLAMVNADPRDAMDDYGYKDGDWKRLKEEAMEDGYDGIIVRSQDYSGGRFNIDRAG
jgi:hypothetical protein